VIDWARPKTAVLLPAAPPKDVGSMVASLGRDFVAPPSAGPGLTGEPIRWLALASIDCLAAPLRGVLSELAAAFGPMTVRWTCRDKQLNARVGGARRSYHLTGNAVDFNMTGNYRAILSFLKGNKLVGGLKHYGQGAFHIDTGPRRTW
jgi:Peptidase M15